MRIVKLGKLVVEGFRSCQLPVTLELDSKGITLVKGLNGAGKTTLFSALCWVLYKTNLNDTNNDKVQTWDYQRLPSYRGTRVVLMCTVGDTDYMFARHLNFKGTTRGLKGESKLMLFAKSSSDVRDFVQEDLVGEAQHKGDMQNYINTVIGLDSRMFTNSILFGQRMSRLVNATNDDKRKLFETLFELDFVEPAKEAAKLEKTKLEEGIYKIDTKLRTYNTSLSTLNDQLERDSNIITVFNTQKATRVQAAKDNLSKTQTRITETEKLVKEYQDLLPKGDSVSHEAGLKEKEVATKAAYEAAQDVLSETEKAVRNGNREITSTTQTLNKLDADLKGVAENCPYCKNPLNAAEVKKTKQEITAKIKTEEKVLAEMEKSVKASEKLLPVHQKAVETTKDAYDKARAARVSLEQQLDSLNHNKTQLAVEQGRLSDLQKSLPSLEQAVKQEQAAEPPKVDLQTTKDAITNAEKEIKKLEELKGEVQARLDKVKWWTDKGFASGGLKAFVFSAMLNQLNEYVKRYAGRLGLRIKFGVDLSKASKPFTTTCFKGEHEVDYADLSGGQKQRIDIILAFAMHDLISHTAKVNLLIMDEIFEGLDDEGIETAFDLIRLKAGEGRSVFVVTHASLIDSLNAKTMWVDQDEQNCTYLR